MISKKNILDLKPRRDVYQFISKNPGMSITDISKKMKISRSTLRHHLRHLIKSNLINEKVDRKNKRLFVSGLIGARDKELLKLLRQRIPFRIIMYLFCPGFCSITEIARDSKVSPRIIHFHIKKLIDMELIKPIEVKDGSFVTFHKAKPILSKKPVGREILYMWKDVEYAKEIYRLLITYQDSTFKPSVIDDYNDFDEGYNRLIGWNYDKKNLCYDKVVDNIIKIVTEEICYFPFHF